MGLLGTQSPASGIQIDFSLVSPLFVLCIDVWCAAAKMCYLAQRREKLHPAKCRRCRSATNRREYPLGDGGCEVNGGSPRRGVQSGRRQGAQSQSLRSSSNGARLALESSGVQALPPPHETEEDE